MAEQSPENIDAKSAEGVDVSSETPLTKSSPLPYVGVMDVVLGGFESHKAYESNECQNIIYKVLIQTSWLSKFAIPEVRDDFLNGKIGLPHSSQMLDSLDRIREMVLPFPDLGAVPHYALNGLNFLMGFFRQDATYPSDLWGHDFPIQLTYGEWYQYLGKLSSSEYWRRHATNASRARAPMQPNDLIVPKGDEKPASSSAVVKSRGTGKDNDRSDRHSRAFTPPRHDHQQEARVNASEHLPNGNTVGNHNRVQYLGSVPNGTDRPYQGQGGYRDYSPDAPFEEEPYCGGHFPRQPPPNLDPGVSLMTGLQALVSQLNRKEVVEPLKFGGHDGSSIGDFFTKFEKYFERKYDEETDPRDKAQILRNFLTGPAKGAYTSLSGDKRPYPDIRDDLFTWYAAERRSMRAANEMSFLSAKKEEKESYKLFAMRLVRLCDCAYPSMDAAEKEEKLITKFKAAVPESFQRVLRDSCRTAALLSGQAKLAWKEIELLAGAEDRLTRDQRQDREPHGEETQVYLVDPGDNPPATTNSRVFENGNKNHSARQRDSGRGPSRPLTPPNNEEIKNNNSRQNQGRSWTHDRQVPRGACFHCGQRGHFANNCNNANKRPDQRTQQGRQPSQTRPIITCGWCGRLGHKDVDCWVRQGRCVGCGDKDHPRAQCPKYNPKPKCSQCDGDHWGMNCTQQANLN